MHSRIKQEAVVASVIALAHTLAFAIAYGASLLSAPPTASSESDRKISPTDAVKVQPVPVSTFARPIQQPRIQPDPGTVQEPNTQPKTAEKNEASPSLEDRQKDAPSNLQPQQEAKLVNPIPKSERSKAKFVKPSVKPPQKPRLDRQRHVTDSNSVEVELHPLETMSEQAIVEAVHSYNTKLQKLNVVLTFNELEEAVVVRLGDYFILQSTVGDRQFVDRTGRAIDPSSIKLGHYSISMRGHAIPPGVAFCDAALGSRRDWQWTSDFLGSISESQRFNTSFAISVSAQ